MSKGTLTERVATWMRGRNGSDELGNAVLAIAVVLIAINIFANSRIVATLALLLAVYSCFRMASRDIARRTSENRLFLSKIGPARDWLRNPKAALDERRAYKHLTCPHCHQKVRVPRGKGRLRVTCPSCREKFEARS